MYLKSFEDHLLQELRDPEFAIAYLEDALEDTTEEFLIALGLYVKANGGIALCAERAGITADALQGMLSKTGNLEFPSIQSVLRANGLHMSIQQNVPELVAA